jgi:hypothetical protein
MQGPDCPSFSLCVSFPCHPSHIQDQVVLDVGITQSALHSRSGIKQNKTKQNKTKQNKTKQNKTKQNKRPQSRISRDRAERWMRKGYWRGTISHMIPDPKSTCFPILRNHKWHRDILSDWLHCCLQFMRTGVTYWTLWNRDR